MENLFSRHMNDFKKKELLRCSEIEVMIKNDICQTFNFNFFLKKKTMSSEAFHIFYLLL